MIGFAKLRSDLVSSKTSSGDSVVYTMKDPITGTYFRLREPEYWLVNQLDGTSSPEDVAERFREKFNLNIGAQDVQQFIDTIEKLFFLDDGRAEQQISRSAYRMPDRKGRLGRILYIKLKAFKPGRFLDRLTSIYSHFHNRFWLAIAVALVVVGVSLLLANLSQFNPGLRQLLNVGSIVIIILGIFLLVMFHEFAHAVICRFYGGEVREIGFLLMYFQPCFYADLSDAWLFEKKSQRLAVTWAGPICQLILLSLAVIVWRITVPGTFVSTFARIVATVGWFTLLVNLNPLLKLDGYYLLSDWVEIPNLRRKAFAYLGNMLKRRVLGWPIEKIETTGRERRIYLVYSVLAALFSFGLLSYLLYIVGAYLTEELGGLGLILLFAFVLFIIKDGLAALVRGAIQHVKYMKNLLKNPVRLGVYSALVVAVILFVFVVPFPHRVSGEVSVEPLADYTLRLDDNGLLETRLQRGGSEPINKASFVQLTTTDMAVLDILPMVEDGQKVKANDTLAILTSSQVTHDIAAAKAELERLQGQLTLLKAPPKKEQIDEAVAEVEAAQANLDRLKRERERSEELAKKNLIAAEQLEAVRSDEQIAVAELANKESALRLLKSPPRPEEEQVIRHEIDKQDARIEFLKRQAEAQVIVAPFAGVISSKQHDKNILSLEQNSHVELLVPVSDFEIPLIKVGETVMVKVRSFPHLTFFGSVVRIPQSTNSETGRFPVSVVLDNPGGILQQGMTGYAKIEVGHASLVKLAYRKLLSNLRVEFWSWW